METLAAFLAAQPLLALFLVIGLGYALGEVSLGGLALGVGAVLFVGLAVGALVPGARPPPLLGLLGLVMFLYGIGIQYGRQFVAGLTGAAGRRANLLALLGLAAGVVMALASIGAGLPTTYVTGLFAGAMTSTAALQAAIEVSGSQDPAVGYSVAYPIGVIGPILCMHLFRVLLRPKVEAPGLGG
jgi:putative transport protein